MKIRDLGLIDITNLDAQIDFLKHNRDKMEDYKKLEIDFKIAYLESLKRELIPATKLADIAFDKGAECYQKSYDWNTECKERFLNRDIKL